MSVLEMGCPFQGASDPTRLENGAGVGGETKNRRVSSLFSWLRSRGRMQGSYGVGIKGRSRYPKVSQLPASL